MILDAKIYTDQKLSPQKKVRLTKFLANLTILLPTIKKQMILLGQEPIENQIPDWVIGGAILLLIFGIPWAISALRNQSGYGALVKESHRQAKQLKANPPASSPEWPYSRREIRQAASALQQAARQEINAVEKKGFSLGAVDIYINSVGNSWPFAKTNVINLKEKIVDLDARIAELTEQGKFDEARWAKNDAVQAVHEIKRIMETHPPEKWNIFH